MQIIQRFYTSKRLLWASFPLSAVCHKNPLFLVSRHTSIIAINDFFKNIKTTNKMFTVTLFVEWVKTQDTLQKRWHTVVLYCSRGKLPPTRAHKRVHYYCSQFCLPQTHIYFLCKQCFLPNCYCRILWFPFVRGLFSLNVFISWLTITGVSTKRPTHVFALHTHCLKDID